MGQALYRKYRSKSLNEVIGQEHIVKTLGKALKSGRISHAYLFTGPRGVGKTSVARILAHEVNGLPYDDDSMHLDIIEIDAASNRRIDEIRDLRDKVHITPTSAKYKVYIIDEVHMLTREAFNALLKTLEEPPAHCIFILATTEAHKLPETIISRTQRFNFKPVGKATVAKHLASLASREKIDITKGALDLLAEHGQGSFRDSISLLDQLSSEKITEESVRDILGLPSDSAIDDLISKISTSDPAGVLGALESLDEQGSNPVVIARELATKLRKELIKGSDQAWIPRLLNQLIDVASSPYPRDKLEIYLLEASNNSRDNDRPSGSSKHEVEPQQRKPRPTQQFKETSEAVEAIEMASASHEHTAFNMEAWPKLIEHIKNHAPSLYTALRLAKPSIVEDRLVLHFQFPLHQKKVNQPKHRLLIENAIEQLCGETIRVDCIVDKERFEQAIKSDLLPEITQTENTHSSHTHAISNIFGTSEVLES